MQENTAAWPWLLTTDSAMEMLASDGTQDLSHLRTAVPAAACPDSAAAGMATKAMPLALLATMPFHWLDLPPSCSPTARRFIEFLGPGDQERGGRASTAEHLWTQLQNL